MGAFRLALSLLVVGSHVGGMGDTPAGGTAVASFFAISGFLMARTIAENYRGSGFMRFYLNRVIRLAPPLIAAVLLTALVLWTRDSRGFALQPNGTAAYMPVDLPSSPATLVEWNPTGFPSYVHPQFHLVPQAWSLLVEGAFYLVAPLAVLLFERRLAALVWIVAAASFALAVASAQLHLDWMRSPVATGWMFLLGMQAYFLAHTTLRGVEIGARARQLASVPLAFVVILAIGTAGIPIDVCFILAPWLVVGWLVLGQWHSRPSHAVDLALGNLSYGVFLGHFLGTLMMLWIAEAVYRTTGVFGIFGTPDGRLLHVSAYVFALATGAAIYYALERPLDKIRAIVRRRRTFSPRRAVDVAIPTTH